MLSWLAAPETVASRWESQWALCRRGLPATGAMHDLRLNQIYEGTDQINLLAFVESFWESDLWSSPVNPR